MSIWGKIKETIKNMIHRKPRLKEGKDSEKETEAIFEISESDKSGTKEQLANLSRERKKIIDEKLSPEAVDELSKVVTLNGGSIGWTHNEQPLTTGKMGDKNFAAFSRKNVRENQRGLTICMENGDMYDIINGKDGEGPSSYREEITEEDGTKRSFSASLGVNDSIYNTLSRNGVKLTESAFPAIMYGEAFDFEHYAQPSVDLLQEYASATGLPIILAGEMADDLKKKKNIVIDNLNTAIQKEGSTKAFPYVVKIEAIKEATENEPERRQLIEYVYSSSEAYRNGESPKMVYIDGFDGRSKTSGMFRLLNEKGKNGEDIYIDNRTFRKEKGKFLYDTLTLDKIKALTGKMYPELSEKSKRALVSGVRMPDEIETIYNKSFGIKTLDMLLEESIKTQDETENTGEGR